MRKSNIDLNFGLFRAGCIYTLTCPETNLVRYVGKTFNPKRRFYDHCSISTKDKSRKAVWVRSLIKKNKKPIINVIDSCDEFNWEEKEIAYIKLYKSVGARLLNHSNGGGQDSLNYKFTKEQSNKVSNALKGVPKSKEHIVNAKEALNDKWNNDSEYRELMISKAKKVLNELTIEQKEKANSKRRVWQRQKMKVKLCDLYKVNKRIQNKDITRIEAAKELGCSRDNIYWAYKIYTKLLKINKI
jgi:hypothetical protein